MQNLLSILFFIKRAKANKDQESPIYLRITYAGKRVELSTMRKVPVEKWNSSGNKVDGHSVRAKEINRHLEQLKEKVYKIYQDLVLKDEIITSVKIRDIFLGKERYKRMVLVIFEDHNTQMAKLLGKEYSPRTLQRYETTKNHLKQFINLQYKDTDYPIKKIDVLFINSFIYYLKSERDCSQNSALKYLAYLKKIVRIAFANGWIEKDPFFNLKFKTKQIEREYLTKEELTTIINKKFAIPRLEQIKDLFLFSCYTGLSYADVSKLCQNDIVIGIDGEKWIRIKRIKTGTPSNIPILPIAKNILLKYKPKVNQPDQKLLPTYSNQRTNSYLKEIADTCGINKNLTFHIARHTFATTVTLSNGVPIESVSKMLGHRSLKITQHYAKIIDKKLGEDMQLLKKKMQTEFKSGGN